MVLLRRPTASPDLFTPFAHSLKDCSQKLETYYTGCSSKHSLFPSLCSTTSPFHHQSQPHTQKGRSACQQQTWDCSPSISACIKACGNIAQACGGIAQICGGIAQACGGIAQACSGIAQACGGIAQACGGIVQEQEHRLDKQLELAHRPVVLMGTCGNHQSLLHKVAHTYTHTHIHTYIQ